MAVAALRYRWNILDTKPGSVNRRETRVNLVKVAAQLLREQGPTRWPPEPTPLEDAITGGR